MLAPFQPKPLSAFLLALAVAACGHSTSGAGYPADASATDSPAHEAAAGDAPAGSDALAAPETSSGVEAGEADDAGDDGEAGPIQTLCTGLGATCKDSTTCLCGVGSGCTFDNVACTSGQCTVAYAVELDAGEACCAGCQGAYDSCTTSSATCLSQWMTCNDTCGAGQCPVVCLAALTP